jgi:surface antigen
MRKRLAAAALSGMLAIFAANVPAKAEPYLQCVTFARAASGIQLFGDAWTWWQQATGKYAKGFEPEIGSVLVFKPEGHMRRGHVAVVSQVLTDRVIQITHANWSPVGGRRGRVEQDVTVVDVSDKGDWSQVNVWYGPANDVGSKVYTTYGFIYATPEPAPVQVADVGRLAGN